METSQLSSGLAPSIIDLQNPNENKNAHKKISNHTKEKQTGRTVKNTHPRSKHPPHKHKHKMIRNASINIARNNSIISSGTNQPTNLQIAASTCCSAAGGNKHNASFVDPKKDDD
jgi:hypothetical protein